MSYGLPTLPTHPMLQRLMHNPPLIGEQSESFRCGNFLCISYIICDGHCTGTALYTVMFYIRDSRKHPRNIELLGLAPTFILVYSMY